MFQARVDDVLDGLDVEAEVKGGQLGGEELPDAGEEFPGSHVERGGGEGSEGVLQGTWTQQEEEV